MASISKVVKCANELQQLQTQMRTVMGATNPDLSQASALLDRQEALVALIQAEAKVPRSTGAVAARA